MDDEKDDKGLVEKTIEAVKDMASSVTNAAKSAKEPDPKPDPEQVAGTTNEQVYIPEATDAAAMPPPLILTKPVAKKKRNARVKQAPAKMLPKKTAAKKASKKASKKSAPKAAKKSTKKSARKTKLPAGRKAVAKKTAKKVAKKKNTKKSKR